MNVTRTGGLLAWAALVCAAVVVLGLCIGSAGFENTVGALLGPPNAERAMAQQIVWDIRLPRTLGALAAGALLGLAGALAQGLFRNPLADPYLLGSASGASLGVALALASMGSAGMLGSSVVSEASVAASVFSSSVWVRLGLTGAAFAGAVLAVMLTLSLARGLRDYATMPVAERKRRAMAAIDLLRQREAGPVSLPAAPPKQKKRPAPARKAPR